MTILHTDLQCFFTSKMSENICKSTFLQSRMDFFTQTTYILMRYLPIFFPHSIEKINIFDVNGLFSKQQWHLSSLKILMRNAGISSIVEPITIVINFHFIQGSRPTIVGRCLLLSRMPRQQQQDWPR